MWVDLTLSEVPQSIKPSAALLRLTKPGALDTGVSVDTILGRRPLVWRGYAGPPVLPGSDDCGSEEGVSLLALELEPPAEGSGANRQ